MLPIAVRSFQGDGTDARRRMTVFSHHKVSGGLESTYFGCIDCEVARFEPS